MPTHQLVFGCGETPARECSEDDDPLVFLAREGFGAYELNLGEQNVSEDLKPQTTRMGMLPVLRCAARDVAESEVCLAQAKKFGAAAVSMRVGNADAKEEETRLLIQTVLENFTRARINLRFEIHPSSAFTDVEQTTRWCGVFPEVTLALDAELLLNGLSDATKGLSLIQSPVFGSLVPRTAMLRSGIDDSANLTGEVPAVVKELWRAVMNHWRRHAPAGRWLLFVFDADPSQQQAMDPKSTWTLVKNFQEAALSCWKTALNAPITSDRRQSSS